MDKAEVTIFVIIANLVLLVFILAAIVFLFQFRKRKLLHLQDTQNLKAQHEQQLLSSKLEMQQETMQHIGREIHDNVGQKLTLASLYAQQILLENVDDTVSAQVREIAQTLAASLDDLRLLSKTLTDAPIGEQPFEQLLEAELEKIGKASQIKVEKDIGKINGVGDIVKTNLLRIVQEFFQNSIKHSKCSQIYISLKKQDAGITLVLQDNGVGYDVDNIAKNKGIGIQNIRNRASTINGDIELYSQINKGTQLKLFVPTFKK